jgi:hypothetical protein
MCSQIMQQLMFVRHVWCFMCFCSNVIFIFGAGLLVQEFVKARSCVFEFHTAVAQPDLAAENANNGRCCWTCCHSMTVPKEAGVLVPVTVFLLAVKRRKMVAAMTELCTG